MPINSTLYREDGQVMS